MTRNPWPIDFLRVFRRALALRGLLVAGALGAAVADAGATSRVLVQPPRSTVRSADLREPDIRASQCLSLYLYDWFGAAPEARLVDEVQARSVLGTLNSPAWVAHDAQLYTAVNAVVAVDALIVWRWAGGRLTLDLQRRSGCRPFEAPWADVRSVPQALRAITDFLSSELAIRPSTAPLACGLSAEDPQWIEDYYLTQRLRAEWIDNSGEKQLDLLRSYLKRLPADPWAASAIVRAGAAMSEDERAVIQPARYIMMVRQALLCLLGTAREPVAIEFVKANRHLPEVIEKELVSAIERAGQDEVAAAFDASGPTDSPDGAMPGVVATVGGAAGILSGPKTRGQQAGAIRCLGAMRSRAALAQLERIAKTRELTLRQAVAQALGEYASPTGDVTLADLAGDADARTAFLAGYGLWRRGRCPADLPRLAGAFLEQDPVCDAAVEVLSREGEATAAARLTACLTSPRARQRGWAAEGLLRLGALTGANLTAVLNDPDGAVLRQALTGLATGQVAAVRERLVALANHPDSALAESARRRLETLPPADVRERKRFELAVEHPYVRRQIVAALAADGSAAALDEIEGACGNADPHVRVYAIETLARLAPERGGAAAMRRLQDPHRWVRLQAAAVAARSATAADAGAVKAALAAERDDATLLYLDDALARAEGRPPPTPRPGANRPRPERTAVFLCGHGEDCVRSPIQGYYELKYDPDEPARKAHAAGKIFLARANQTAKNPAQVLLSSDWGDGFWLGMEAEFGDAAALDGIVLGEESMYFRCWNEWGNGWRLFCREAGIDPDRVAGDRERLTALEKHAWWRWEQRVAIEGFNAMYDYVKLRFGKLRPGFQVCTFMPDQNGPCDFDREWKFDIGAGYNYETGNRHRYTQIRRFKTLWPDRPVLWLCDATPGGLHAPLNYRYAALRQPLPSPHSPAYADALCAWLAGADPGYFYGRLALGKDTQPGPAATGVWLFLEQLYAGSRALEAAMAHMFQGVEEMYRTGAEIKKAHAAMASGDMSDEAKAAVDVVESLEEPAPEKDPFRLKVKDEMERMRLGLLLERKLAWDGARLLADLPRPPQTNAILLVGDMRAEAGALRLPSAYDALDRLNAIEGQDLARYRVIAVANGEAAPPRRGTVKALTDWLKATSGMLYVRGWLNTSNAVDAAPSDALDERHTIRWPWAADVAYAKGQYRLSGGGAAAVEGEYAPALVFWRGGGFRGGAVFDSSDLAPDRLRDALNRLGSEQGIGIAFTDPMGVEAAALPGMKATVSDSRGGVTNVALKGVDPLTGILDPVLGRERAGAFTADGFTGAYVAAWNGVGVLSEQPLRGVHAVEGGLELECTGLIQAVSVKHDVRVRCDGPAPAPVAAENTLAWLLESDAPGLARVAREDTGAVVTFVRTQGRVRITVP